MPHRIARRHLPRLVRAARLAWAAPCSLVGLALAAVMIWLGGRAVRAHGTLEVSLAGCRSALPAWACRFPFRAMALGHVIVAFSREELEQVRAHEIVHVRQYERWGPAFFPAYAASSLWQLLKGRDPYWHNHFEVQARALGGGPRP